MGHERAGRLPKSKKWIEVVEAIAKSAGTGFDVANVAAATLKCTQDIFFQLDSDPSIEASFDYLIGFSTAMAKEDPLEFLNTVGMPAPESASPFSVARALERHLAQSFGQPEYRELAYKAATHALFIWFQRHRTTQESLSSELADPFEAWRECARGAGFAELALLYFSFFVQHYLNFYLDREASIALSSVSERDAFQEAIENHVYDIVTHATETGRITQSLSAGWYHKRGAHSLPDKNSRRNTLRYALSKIREELRIEGGRK